MANLESAAAIYKFFINMPDLCLKSVYKEIVEDCFRLAELCPVDEARELLIKSICDNYEENGNGLKNHNLPIFTKWVRRNKSEKSRGEVESDIEKAIKERDYDMLSRLLMDDILYKDEVVSLYELFILKNKVEGDDANLVRPNEPREVDVIDSNPFRMLGFMSFYPKYCDINPNSETDSDKTILYNFRNEYYSGYIMDCVFDTIYKCNVTMLSRELWNYVKKTTEENQSFCDITQKRFDEYRKFYPHIQEEKFKCKKDDNNNELSYALPKLKPGLDLKWTFNFLCEKGYLLKDEESIFTERLFSGEDSKVENIHWLKPTYTLSYFMGKCSSFFKEKKTNKFVLFDWAIKIFRDKNNKPFNIYTLLQGKGDDPFNDIKLFR